MKKILFLILLNISAGATWLKDIPQAITQSNGMTINCFASGDQYVHRLHDRDNYTIVLNQDDGDFYYAEKYGEKLRPSPYKVGIVDPVNTELVPGLRDPMLRDARCPTKIIMLKTFSYFIFLQ